MEPLTGITTPGQCRPGSNGNLRGTPSSSNSRTPELEPCHRVQFNVMPSISLHIGSFTQTETTVLKIHTDILASLDAGKVTALTLLDLSAAFDTTDHTILPRRFDDWFGVTDKALNWFKSYLTGRCQRIKIDDVCPPKPISNLEFLKGQF